MKKLVKQLLADQDQIQVKIFFDSDSGQSTINIFDLETSTLQHCKVYPAGEVVTAYIDYFKCRRSFK